MSESESEVAQLCPTLCDPVDCSSPGSSVPGILQARILEWVAMPFSSGFYNVTIKYENFYETILSRKPDRQSYWILVLKQSKLALNDSLLRKTYKLWHMGLTSVLSKLRAIFLHVAKSHVQC